MTDIQFGRLRDLSLREAWKHEAHEFTPWLAANIDHLSEVIGIPLEIVGTEVAVETFSADILARNPMDGTVVLIENQLENTDHTHLGQIMTYLAGLEANTVVWIAPGFREPHRSAIRWLNEHTADGFSFFAVRARVVQIGDSPYAPIFEIVEKPNDWEREVKQKATSEGAAYYDVKERFWDAFVARHPELVALGITVSRYPTNYIALHDDPHIDLSVWIGKSKSGIYVRSGWGEPAEPVGKLLEKGREALEASLGTSLGPTAQRDHFLSKSFPLGHSQEKDWPTIMDWMTDQISQYRTAIQPILDVAPEG